MLSTTTSETERYWRLRLPQFLPSAVSGGCDCLTCCLTGSAPAARALLGVYKCRLGCLLLIIGTSVYASHCVGQTQSLESWQAVTVCDLVKDHRYDGARVRFRAKVLDGQLHGILLKDDRCEKGLRLTTAESVRDQDDYKQFMRTIYSTRKLSADHTITADFYGKFVYRPAEPRLKWALDAERISNIEVK